ncbi:MAG TPA: hypothetical protein VGB99_18390 [Acidobacteriota bacterium]
MTWISESAAALLDAVGATSTVVLAAFAAISARNLLLLVLEDAAPLLRLVRGLFTVALIGLTTAYAMFAQPRLALDGPALAIGAGIAVAILLITFFRLSYGADRPRRPARRVAGGLAKTALLVGLLLIALLTLMTAGFLELSEDRPILLVDVTGRTRPGAIEWSPPNQPPQTANLLAHQVLFRSPEGERVAEAWIFGDEVAVKGRVLRLAPWLQAAGLRNLYELQFAHNGYGTAARQATLPSQAIELPPTGPLAVHPWWRGLQRRLLGQLQEGTAESSWVRAVTVESTYFPLVDAQGDPMRAVHRVVITPGGLSSS